MATEISKLALGHDLHDSGDLLASSLGRMFRPEAMLAATAVTHLLELKRDSGYKPRADRATMARHGVLAARPKA